MESQANISKFSAPRLHRTYPRMRLFKQLDAARAMPLIWISAPAGSGKTSLIASWLKARGHNAHWYQLDGGDTDIASFFYHLGLLGRRAAPHRKSPMPLLTPECLADLQAFSHHFFRELFKRIKATRILVLDNYQDAGSSLHKILQAGCNEIPGGVNVVIISRNDPPPAFARFQANGTLIQLDWEPFRLTQEETGASVNRVVDRPLDDTDIQALMLAQAEFLNGDTSEAKCKVVNALNLAERDNNRLVLYLGWLLKADMASQLDEKADCLEALRRALGIARAEGMFVHYLPQPAIRALYALALVNGIETDYVCGAIRTLCLSPPEPQHAPDNWPFPVRIYTLGRFSLLIDGIALGETEKKKQAKPLTLLKALVAMGARDVHEEQLQEALWPDAEGDAAHRVLITNLQRLRRLLGDAAAIDYSDRRLSLSPRHCWVDTWAFERGIANEQMQAGAIIQYRSGFLPSEEAFWALVLRERLWRKFSRAVIARGQRLEARDAWAEAITHYQQALDADPGCETYYQGLMRVYTAQGQYQQALKAYEDCRQLMHALHDIAPSPQTELLHQEIRVVAIEDLSVI